MYGYMRPVEERHEHDCDACEYLGTCTLYGKETDWYYCPPAPDGAGSSIEEKGTMVARYSSEGPDYWSSPIAMILRIGPQDKTTLYYPTAKIFLAALDNF